MCVLGFIVICEFYFCIRHERSCHDLIILPSPARRCALFTWEPSLRAQRSALVSFNLLVQYCRDPRPSGRRFKCSQPLVLTSASNATLSFGYRVARRRAVQSLWCGCVVGRLITRKKIRLRLICVCLQAVTRHCSFSAFHQWNYATKTVAFIVYYLAYYWYCYYKNNLLMNLAGSSWRSNANILRKSGVWCLMCLLFRVTIIILLYFMLLLTMVLFAFTLLCIMHVCCVFNEIFSIQYSVISGTFSSKWNWLM